jgi:hypothetical protein
MATASAAAQEIPATSARYIFWHLTPSEGTTPEQAQTVERSLRTFFSEKRGKLIMDAAIMDSLLMVEGNEKFLRCGTGVGCLAGLGEAAGVPWVITGTLSIVHGHSRLELLLLDRNKKVVVSRALMALTGLPSAEQLAALDLAMFEPEKFVGGIDLTCSVPGAEVLLDGKKVGVTPLIGPLSNLPAGIRNLEVRKDGHQPFSREVDIPVNAARTVVAMLPELPALVTSRPPPFYRNAWFWTAAGVGVASLALGVGMHLDANQQQESADLYKKGGYSEKFWRPYQDKADREYLISYIGFGFGAAGLLAAGVFVVLDLIAKPGEDKPANPQKLDVALLRLQDGLGFLATVRF